MRSFFSFIFISVLFFSCSNAPYEGRDVVGANEFVIDSYKIKQGKSSILELEGRPLNELSPKLLEEYKDVIQDGDVLTIALYHPTRTDIASYVEAIGRSVGFRVSDGKIALPDLSPIEIKNLTLTEAREKIQKEYAKHIQDIEIFLAFKDRLERKVELAGMVAIDSVPVNGKIRLFEVLAKAKVAPESNLFKSYVVRENAPLPVDLVKLMQEGDMSQNIVMRGGDKIYIAQPGASNIMVLGEVGKQGIVPLPTGYMPLREALAKAGGILFTGSKAYIQVIRGNLTRPKIYTLNWRHIVRLPTDSMLLMPGDIVYVAATPISQWNRLINQLLPTFTVYELFAKGIKGVIVQDGGVNVN